LSNAIKYRSAAPRASVTAADDGAYWRFVVTDNGPGIPASQIERIWGLFQTTRPQDGTGIGLALVKRITEAQGGRVFVESSPGTFQERPVVVGKPVGSSVRVVSGLKSGETVVVDGAMLLSGLTKKPA